MRLTQQQVQHYEQQGYLVLENYFSPAELELLQAELPHILAEESARRILEKSGAVRSVFASHITSEVFKCFIRLARLIEPVTQILRSDVYIHQFKINAKTALAGEQWEWHQDFLYWHKEDCMPEPRVLTAVLFVEDVNEFNGPMLIIPGSHLDGMIDLDVHDKYRSAPGNGALRKTVPPSWASTLTADLKYKIDKQILMNLVNRRSIKAITCPAGTLMFFHGNLFHASGSNLSPRDRISIFASYNSVENVPRDMQNPRPLFIAERDGTPLTPLADSSLLEMGARVG
ncbi:MAG TPA: phytanoyl-CoA dioxygenase family protein [Pyrinomonadaceae bacterium]|nr:phytanoyl-CoA dioxygenase family protein [Pyrinomonadaceae bacterium]